MRDRYNNWFWSLEIALLVMTPIALGLMRTWRVPTLALPGGVKGIVLAGLLPVALRCFLLPIWPVPIPYIQDEFVHLMIASTLANGRLANPPLVDADPFEIAYILQTPTYSGKYPIGHGAFLAIGIISGLGPWAGVLLESAMMFAAFAWAMRIWLPPVWATIGCLITLSRLWPWMDNYWGGALPSLAGALVLGSLGVMAKRPKSHRGNLAPIPAGIGFGLLILSRPYEGLFLGLATLPWFLPRTLMAAVGLGVPIVVAVGVASFHNYAVSGKIWEPPYITHQKQYGTPAPMVFQSPIELPTTAGRFEDLRRMYHWQREAHENARKRPVTTGILRGAVFWREYVSLMYTPFLFVFPAVLRSVKLRVHVVACVGVLIGSFGYPFYFAHYQSPALFAFFVLLTQAVRVSKVRCEGFLGRGFIHTRVPLIMAAASLSTLVVGGACIALEGRKVPLAFLVRNELLLEAKAGSKKYLVLISYPVDQNFQEMGHYNDADLSNSRVVWARAFDPHRDALTVREFGKGRDVLLMDWATGKLTVSE